jgi:hypothetical protein
LDSDTDFDNTTPPKIKRYKNDWFIKNWNFIYIYSPLRF